MIIVFGSIYMNLDMRVKRFPENGETALSSSYTMLPGGRAANQALAATRVEAKTALVGCVGDDGPGLRILQNLKRNGVMTSGVAKSTEFPTGIATIVHDKADATRILVAMGANSAISADQAPHDIFRSKNILLTQLEIALEQNAIVMKTARDKGAKIILNANPLAPIPLSVVALADYLIINHAKLTQFAKMLKLEGYKDEVDIMRMIAAQAKLTCVTYQRQGIGMIMTSEGRGFCVKSSKQIPFVDASGGEDCFSGTFAGCLHEGKSQNKALQMALSAYAMTVREAGAQEIYPYIDGIKEELESFTEATPL